METQPQNGMSSVVLEAFNRANILSAAYAFWKPKYSKV